MNHASSPSLSAIIASQISEKLGTAHSIAAFASLHLVFCTLVSASLGHLLPCKWAKRQTLELLACYSPELGSRKTTFIGGFEGYMALAAPHSYITLDREARTHLQHTATPHAYISASSSSYAAILRPNKGICSLPSRDAVDTMIVGGTLPAIIDATPCQLLG